MATKKAPAKTIVTAKLPAKSMTLEQLFEFTNESCTDAYEVLRTVGMRVRTESGEKECRVEVVRRKGESSLYAAHVWVEKEGLWKRWQLDNHTTLNRTTPDDTLRSMINYIRQYMPQS